MKGKDAQWAGHKHTQMVSGEGSSPRPSPRRTAPHSRGARHAGVHLIPPTPPASPANPAGLGLTSRATNALASRQPRSTVSRTQTKWTPRPSRKPTTQNPVAAVTELGSWQVFLKTRADDCVNDGCLNKPGLPCSREPRTKLSV